MGRYLIMGIGGVALAAAVLVFASGSLGQKSPGVSMETTASIPLTAGAAPRAADPGDEGGHSVAGDWVPQR
ncbi:MAG: hypothetical protein IT535_10725 [Bauldia sp.]|nr:hypothetical protein [Bauldia sp.]